MSVFTFWEAILTNLEGIKSQNLLLPVGFIFKIQIYTWKKPFFQIY